MAGHSGEVAILPRKTERRPLRGTRQSLAPTRARVCQQTQARLAPARSSANHRPQTQASCHRPRHRHHRRDPRRRVLGDPVQIPAGNRSLADLARHFHLHRPRLRGLPGIFLRCHLLHHRAHHPCAQGPGAHRLLCARCLAGARCGFSQTPSLPIFPASRARSSRCDRVLIKSPR